MSALSVLLFFASPALGHFIYVSTAKTWDAANTYCQSQYGTNLATIKDEYDARIMKGKEEEVGTDFWIGLNDLINEGAWGWASGFVCEGGNCDDLDWWYSTQPNDLSSNQDCGAVHSKTDTAFDNLLNDASCSTSYPFMCDAPTVINASTFGVAIGWEDYVLYAVAALNVVMLTCLVVFCLCTRQTPKYGKVAAYDSDSKL